MGSRREDWEVEQEKRKILQDSFVTEIKKKNFINKVKNEWSESLMKEPNKIKVKPTVWVKFKKLIGWN